MSHKSCFHMLTAVYLHCTVGHWGPYINQILIEANYNNCIVISKVKAVLLNKQIFTIDGVASGRVCAQPAKPACFLNIKFLGLRQLVISIKRIRRGPLIPHTKPFFWGQFDDCNQEILFQSDWTPGSNIVGLCCVV